MIFCRVVRHLGVRLLPIRFARLRDFQDEQGCLGEELVGVPAAQAWCFLVLGAKKSLVFWGLKTACAYSFAFGSH